MSKSALASLSPTQLRVYAEIARASENGVCDTAATVLWRRCEVQSKHIFYKHVGELAEKGLLDQEIISNGVPRVIKLIHG